MRALKAFTQVDKSKGSLRCFAKSLGKRQYFKQVPLLLADTQRLGKSETLPQPFAVDMKTAFWPMRLKQVPSRSASTTSASFFRKNLGYAQSTADITKAGTAGKM